MCSTEQSLSWYDWKSHLLSHTVEKLYLCIECNAQLTVKSDHQTCPPDSIIDIFGEIDIGCSLDGFVCMLCDYFKINNYRLMEHLERDHDEFSSLFEIHVARLTLVPDVRPKEHKIQTANFYVPQELRYVCGIGNCIFHGKNVIDYAEHFRKAHSIIKTYYCPHCNLLMNRLNSLTVEHNRILEHIEYHGIYLHQCISCNLITPSENEMRSHISHEHRDQPLKFWRNKRKTIDTADMELIEIVLDCDLCGERVTSIPAVFSHYKEAHQNYEIGFKALKLIKTTTEDLNVICSFDDSTLYYREALICGLCDENFTNKHKWFSHFTEQHPSEALVLKRDMIWCESSKRLKVIDFDRNMLFYCGFCEDSDGVKSVCNTTAEAIYEHWKEEHKPNESKDFQFYMTEFLACNYCDVVSTFQGLKKHVHQKHAGEKFVPLKAFQEKKQCALCEYDQIDFAEHYERKHNLEIQANVFNPIQLSTENLQNLLHIRVCQKIKCDLCEEMFDTRELYRIHHSIEHTEMDRKSSFSYGKNSIQLIGDCCRQNINPKNFYDHLENHKYSLVCELCAFCTDDPFYFMVHKIKTHESEHSLAELYLNFLQIRYWRSELIFGNGLVVNKFNTQGTDFDYTNNFDSFANRLVAEKAQAYEEYENKLQFEG